MARASKKKLMLPRGYLSWSQLDLWEKNPKEYIAKYFYGKEDFEHDYFTFGKHIADLLAGFVEPNDEVERNLARTCITYGNPEMNLKGIVKSEYGDIALVGQPDDLCKKTGNFTENKTGTGEWTYQKAQNHGQIPFYYLLIKQALKLKPQFADLQWFVTEKGFNGRYLTGRVQTFRIELTTMHELSIRSRIIKAAREIDDAYRKAFTNLV